MIEQMVAISVVFAILMIIYHHALYPMLLRGIAARVERTLPSHFQRRYEAHPADVALPSVHLIVPAYNEQEFIAEKIRNLAALDYPPHRLAVSIVCDGCTDATARIARETLHELSCTHLRCIVIERQTNRGKVAVLNEAIPALKADLVALSDVSALISSDALLLAAAHFNDAGVGVVAGSYQFLRPGTAGEAAYWRYQSHIKAGESAFGSVIGVHGAFYVFRHSVWEPLATDTINDDFILPMNIVNKGFRAVYEPDIVAIELEQADIALDHRRRIRIAAGNAQQAIRIARHLRLQSTGVAFNFLSGKMLRVLMPFLMVWALIGSAGLAATGSTLFLAVFALQGACYAIATLPLIVPGRRWSGIVAAAHYLVLGHIAGLRGVLAYALGYQRGVWSRAATQKAALPCAVHPLSRVGKRAMDLIGAVVGLLLTAPLFPLIALAIKSTSRGPILFRQMRIGRARPDAVALFTMLKFRTMTVDAEAKSGPQWATKNDPRITPVGRFLRKTRLDELPQLLNVLAGDMSLIGPRPERPGFYGKLENEIPFYAERTFDVLPGITGLAQVNQGYDESIDDVRRKVAFDHAYALALSHPLSWFQTDLAIAWKTVAVMVLGRGQ